MITVSIPGSAQAWLNHGERGISSETIFSHLTGLNILWHGYEDTPSDPADLRRCRLLLEQVPEFQKDFVLMTTRGDKWAVLVREWDRLCAVMDEEALRWREPRGWSCFKTYHAMKEIGL